MKIMEIHTANPALFGAGLGASPWLLQLGGWVLAILFGALIGCCVLSIYRLFVPKKSAGQKRGVLGAVGSALFIFVGILAALFLLYLLAMSRVHFENGF